MSNKERGRRHTLAAVRETFRIGDDAGAVGVEGDSEPDSGEITSRLAGGDASAAKELAARLYERIRASPA